MESLALLCTLHADGPATLKRLRRAGCDSLESIESYGASDLANLLEVPPAVARRLLKEARGLSVRLDEGVLDDAEEAPQVSTAAAPDSTPRPQVTTQGFLDQRDYAILGRVLERWSDEKDADGAVTRDAPAVHAVETSSEQNPEIESTRLWPEDQSATSCAMPEDQAGETECKTDASEYVHLLHAGDFEGLDDAMIATLGGVDIESLSDVVEAEPLALAGIMGITYANARRMQFLARAAEPKAEPMPEPMAGPMAEEMAEEMAEPPVMIDAPAPASESPPVAPSLGARGGESAASSSEEDSAEAAPTRKFWEPQSSSAIVTPDPDNEELVIEMEVPEVEASDTSFGDVSAPEEYVSEERVEGNAKREATPEATPEPIDEPSDDLGPKYASSPEPPMPEAATYGTPWPQDSGPELSRPLHVRFPSESPEVEVEAAVEAEQVDPMQAESAPSGECGTDRPLNWDFDLTGTPARLSNKVPAPSEPLPGIPGASASGKPAVDPGSDGVGGPFA